MSGGEGRTKTEIEGTGGTLPSVHLSWGIKQHSIHGGRAGADRPSRSPPLLLHEERLCKGISRRRRRRRERKEDVSALPSEEGGMGTLETNGPIN